MAESTRDERSPRVVAGVDGSQSSLAALRWAASQADRTGATLHAVAAWAWPGSYGWAMPLPDDFDPAADAGKVLKEAADGLRADHPGLAVVTEVVEGHPAAVLVEASRGADLLVVGGRGHSQLAGMLLGSVSAHCVAHAHCPVVVYRNGHEGKELGPMQAS